MLDWICMGEWALWNDRNAMVNGKPIPTENERCEWLHRYIDEFQKVNVIPKSIVTREFYYGCARPCSNKMIINVDAACDMQRDKYGIGVIVRTLDGNTTAAMHGHFPYLLNPLCAEAKAVLEGLRLEQCLEITEIDIYSDSLELISMINGSIDESSEALALLWDINSFTSIRFLHMNRAYNSIAHQLARLGTGSEPMLWFRDLPEWLHSLVSREKPMFVPLEGTVSSSN